MIAASLVAFDVGDAPDAEASHFRANQTTWIKTGPNEVTFTLLNAWRASYYSISGVGDTFNDGSFDFGDGSSAALTWEAIAIDTVNDIVTAQVILVHEYDPTAGTQFWAVQDNCCRLGSVNGHINNSGDDIIMRTLVDLNQNQSPSSTVSPIVGCPVDALCQFTMPVVNNTSGNTKFRLADGTDGFGTQPSGATIDETTGLYSWDTTGATMSTPPTPTFYSTQVIIESWDGNVLVGSIAVDFFIQIGGTGTNVAPVFVAPTPVDGATIDGFVGTPLTFEVAATDADDDHITLSILNRPADATYTQHTDDHGSAGATFTWTPTAVGDTYVILQATDPQGLSATQRAVTLSIGEPQTTVPPTTQTPGSTTPPNTTAPPTTLAPTTVPEVSTTTAPAETTTVPEEPTTTTAASTTTAVVVDAQDTQAPPAQVVAESSGVLALTGSNTVALGLFGLGLALAGAVLVSTRRRLS